MTEKNYSEVPTDHWLYSINNEDLNLLGNHFGYRNFEQRTRAKKQRAITYALSQGGEQIKRLKENKDLFIEEIRLRLEVEELEARENSLRLEVSQLQDRIQEVENESKLALEDLETESEEEEVEGKEITAEALEKREKRRSIAFNVFGKILGTSNNPVKTILQKPPSPEKSFSEAFNIHKINKAGTRQNTSTPKKEKTEPLVIQPATSEGNNQDNRDYEFEIMEQHMENIKKLLQPLAMLGTGTLTFSGPYPDEINRFIKQYETEGQMHNATDKQLSLIHI